MVQDSWQMRGGGGGGIRRFLNRTQFSVGTLVTPRWDFMTDGNPLPRRVEVGEVGIVVGRGPSTMECVVKFYHDTEHDDFLVRCSDDALVLVCNATA